MSEENWCVSIDNALTKKNQYKSKKVQITDNLDFNEVVDTRTYNQIDIPNFRVIPGGKYGCAQFVSSCGPDKLKKMSLGKLSLFVKIALEENYLTYFKTLICWNTNLSSE